MHQETAVASSQPQVARLLESDLETIRYPEGGPQSTLAMGDLSVASVSSIVGVFAQTFSFRENSSTPGRFLEKSVVVSLPPGTAAFTAISRSSSAFTTPDFQFLRERPLGHSAVAVGFRGNNLVCTVRLADANGDDPIAIDVTALVVLFN